ncbi:MAG: hypothetical protein ACRDZR_01245 [Acidimicrobiales bacterium]
MCRNLMDLDSVAQECGWYGWTEGQRDGDMLIYKCGCDDGHTIYIAANADDPEYYERRCEFIRQCKT